jgi:glutamate/tyrosine decarboxylase-like PLP-dependent enzyme
VPGTRHNGHPRFFGYVSSPGTAIASVADFLASTLSANLPAWRSAPAPTELEHLTIDWIKEALGLTPGASGLFTSGGSMANLTALAAARHRAPWRGGRGPWCHGAPGTLADLCLHGGTPFHPQGRHEVSGAPTSVSVAVDGRFRMDVDDLVRRIDADRREEAEPFCVVATAGSVTTGAVDADYTRIMHTDAAEAFAFWDYGLELSRPFRALKVWMTLAHVGSQGVGEAIESNLDCARHLADLVDGSEDFEMLAPVELSIFCFRYLPPVARGRAERSAEPFGPA